MTLPDISARRFPPAGLSTAARRLLPALVLLPIGLAGCAQAPQQMTAAAGHPREYFPASVYGPASRRVVADGQPIPHGGGQYLVGKPYTVAGQTYYPSERKVREVGLASWYGDAFHGRLTANGEVYDRDGFTAAHPTMPLPSYARVTNLRNNYSMVVRVNDRGPYHANRVMDVSRHVAEALDFQRGGTAKVRVEYVGRASLAGSDDAKLYATLHRDAPADAAAERALVAEAPSPATDVARLAPRPALAAPSPDDAEAEEPSRSPPVPRRAERMRSSDDETSSIRRPPSAPARIVEPAARVRIAAPNGDAWHRAAAGGSRLAALASATDHGRTASPHEVGRSKAVGRSGAGEAKAGPLPRPIAAVPVPVRRVRVAVAAEAVHRTGGGVRSPRAREN